MVALRSSSGSALVANIHLLIDTGADVTLLPRAAVDAAGVVADPGRRYELIAFDGSRSYANTVELDMVFAGKAFRGRYLIIDQDRGILGRDVLNSHRVTLDGPAGEWTA